MSGDQVDELFAVLADPTRRRVVQLLGERPRRAGELAQAAGVSAPVVSRHLRILLAAGVVADERVADDARLRVFRLRPESLVALQAWLDQVRAHWTEQLGAFKRHVEAKGERRVETTGVPHVEVKSERHGASATGERHGESATSERHEVSATSERHGESGTGERHREAATREGRERR